MRRALAAAGLAAAAWSCAFPAGPRAAATPQRPTLSSDTNTTAHGTVEIEAGGLWDVDDGSEVPVSVKLGSSPTGEFSFQVSPWLDPGDPGAEGGSGDLVLATRQRVRDQGAGWPALAWELGAKLPTGRRSNSSGENDAFLTAIASADGGWLAGTAWYRLAALGEENERGVEVEHAAALALSTPVAPRLAAFGELAGTWNPERDGGVAFVTLGAAWTMTPWRVIDLACVIGLDGDAPDLRLVLGITENLGPLLVQQPPRR